MSKIESLSSPRLPAPRFRYSPLVKAGPFYRSAGMIALDSNSGKLEAGGAEAEAAKILRNLREALPDFKLALTDLVNVTIYTTDFANFLAINRAWEAVFAADCHLPARTSVGVSALPLGATVEMEFTFYREGA
jgi:2-iminobutanoate/2-iminopropanoate deaminase